MADVEETVMAPEEDGPTTESDLDIMFLLVSGYLVFFMQCGFCMVRRSAVL